jgi:hypothetical protein
MGRCCRVEYRGDVLLYDPPSPLPYERRAVQQGATFVAELDGKDGISLTDLAALPADGQVHLDTYSSFTDSGTYAFAQDDRFRDDNEIAVDADLSAVLAANQARQPIDGYVVPVPRKRASEGDTRLGSFLRIAPAAQYDPIFGFGVQEASAHA